MRILHLVHQYPPEFTGGTEFYTQQLSGQLRQLGHEVAVFYRRPGKGVAQRADPDGTLVWGAGAGPMTPFNRFRATFGQPHLEKAWNDVVAAFLPDLVHIQHLMGLPAALVSALNRRRIPYLITLHDYWWLCANAQLLTNYDNTVCPGPDHRWRNCGRCLLARAGLLHNRVMAPVASPWLRQRQAQLQPVLLRAAARIAPSVFVQQLYRTSGVTAPITQIAHGIERPERVERPPRAAPPLAIIYLGSISPQKGLHIAVQAINQLPPHQVQFTVYGGLTDFPEYVAELRSMIRHNNIHLAGRLPRDRLWSTLSQADVALVPSQWYETYVLTIDEMFAAGVPVLASRLGVLPDRVQDGVDGLLLPPADVDAWRSALQRLLTEPDLLARLRAGIRPVRAMNDHVQAIIQVYEKVLNDGH